MIFIRSLVMALLYLPYAGLASIFCIFMSFLLRNRKIDDAIVVWWGKTSCRMFGVRVKVQGLENLPPGRGAILLFNHTSFFDIFSMVASIPGLRFGAKVELFKIPFFGAAMRRVGNIPIDRAHKEAVFKVYSETQSRIKNGERIALAPEGGRMEKESLAPFKSGPFIFAINAQVPVVPVVIRGAARILPKGHSIPNKDHWTSEIELFILPPISTEGITVEQRPELQKRVFDLMQPYLVTRQN